MTEDLQPRTIRKDVREYTTSEGDLVIARRISGAGPSQWLVTATANDAALTQVQGRVTRNEAGFGGRDWESDIDGQQHPSLIEAMRAAVSIARQRADLAAFGRCIVVDGRCTTHGVRADFDHYLATRPKEHKGHNPVSGIAYND